MSSFGRRFGCDQAAITKDPRADEGGALKTAVPRRSCLQAQRVNAVVVGR
jgi:hypothetical protein